MRIHRHHHVRHHARAETGAERAVGADDRAPELRVPDALEGLPSPEARPGADHDGGVALAERKGAEGQDGLSDARAVRLRIGQADRGHAVERGALKL